MNFLLKFFHKPKICAECGKPILVKADETVHTFNFGFWGGVRPNQWMHSLCYRKHYNVADDEDCVGWYDLAKKNNHFGGTI